MGIQNNFFLFLCILGLRERERERERKLRALMEEKGRLIIGIASSICFFGGFFKSILCPS